MADRCHDHDGYSIRESYISAEIDIVDYRYSYPAWTQSTDELLSSNAYPDDESTKSVQYETITPDAPSKPRIHTRDTEHAPVSIHVELDDHQHEKQYQKNTRDWRRPWHRVEERRSSSSDLTNHKSRYGIELENLSPFPPIGAQSSKHSEPPQKFRPNYKPAPLRWPFQAFLFCLIAGLLAFVEYEIKKLPSLHLKALNNYNPSAMDDHLGDAVPTAQPLLKTSSVVTATRTSTNFHSMTTQATQTPAILVAAPNPTPEPDPRPPETNYPHPHLVTKYCGWTAPEWTMARFRQVVDGMLQQNFLLTEYIDFFSTDDSSWCPCEIDQLDAWSGIWGEGYWKTNDKGCQEVMNLVSSMNELKTKQVLMTRSPFTGNDEASWVPITHWTFTTPPLPTRGFWQYPRTGVNSEVSLPLEIRTVTANTQDVFGNAIAPGKTALFPEAYHKHFIVPLFKAEPCWQSAYLFSPFPSWAGRDPNPDPPCTEKLTSYPTVWWTLPLSKPTPRTAEPSRPTSIGSILQSGTNTPAKTALETLSSNSPSSVPTTSSPQPSSPKSDTTTSTTSAGAQITSTSSMPIVVSQNTPVETSTTTTTSDPIVPILLPTTQTTTTSSSLTSPSPPPQNQTTLKPTTQTTQTTQTTPFPLIPTPHSQPIPPTLFPSPIPTAHPPPHPNHPSGPIPPSIQGAFFNLRTEADYLMASTIPVLLATLLSIPIGVFITSINVMLPFRALSLSNSSGARAEDSVCLPRSGGNVFITGPFLSVRFLRRFGDPLPLLSLLLNILATVLVPLSSEIIRLEFSTMDCPGMVASGRVCAFGMRKSGMSVRATEGILVGMGVLAILMGVVLGRWRSGVATEPWSIAAVAGLGARGEGIGEVVRRGVPVCLDGRCILGGEMERVLEGRRFKLGWYDEGYGIVVVKEAIEDNTAVPRVRVRDPPMRKAGSILRPGIWGGLDRERRELFGRILALVLTAGLLVLILYYENTILDTPFERFMDGQSFGVRVLFTAFGTAVSTYWDYYFSQVSEYQLHQRLSCKAQPARTSILLSPPSYVFVGLWRSLRTKDYLSLNVALAALFAKFTPILFSDIPFRNTVTWKMHEACTWMSVVILSYMVLVLIASLPVWARFTERMSTCQEGRKRRSSPCYTPVRLDTIAGCMYYLCDSKMLKDFEGTSLMGRKERDKLINGMEKRYMFGDVVGVSGVRRVRVDYFLDDPGAGASSTKAGWDRQPNPDACTEGLKV